LLCSTLRFPSPGTPTNARTQYISTLRDQSDGPQHSNSPRHSHSGKTRAPLPQRARPSRHSTPDPDSP